MEILKLNISGEELESSGEQRAFQVALLASVASAAVSFIARFVFGAPLIPEIAAQFVFAVAPIWIVEAAVGLLGPFAKHLGFLACTVVYVLSLLGCVYGFLKLFSAHFTRRPTPLYVAIFTILLLLVVGLLVMPALGAGVFGSRVPQGVLLTTAALAIAYIALGITLSWTSSVYLETHWEKPRLLSRRRLMQWTGYSVVLIGIYDIGRQLLGSWITSGSGRVHRGDGSFPNINNLALEVTPTADFYQVSKNAFDPAVEVSRWRLNVGGLVENPLSLSYDEIRNLPATVQYATLCCISNEVGGDLIGNATWRGIRLRDLLTMAGVKAGVVDIVLRAADDYTDSIPINRALFEGTLLAYEMNDQPLTAEHGFPLRLIVPGIYGMKNVKWIKSIEAVDFDLKGYWQRRGWDDVAEYKTMSRIDAPDSSVKGETEICGIAFAGDRGVNKVEVSTDGGTTWEQAEIKSALGSFTWVLWHKRWSPESPGNHRVLVRATDGLGVVQTSRHAPPAPDGSSGYHSVAIKSV